MPSPRHPLAPAAVTGDLASQRWWPYTRLASYPHMLSDDRAVWERWISANPGVFQAVCYDVHVGQTWELTPAQVDNLAAIAAGLTRLRIDVIGWDGSALWVVEVKPRTTPGALGQALVYTTLLGDLDPPGPQLIPAVLSGWHHPALIHAGAQLGVALLTAPDPVQQTLTYPPVPD